MIQAHKTKKELEQSLEEARELVRVGGQYSHYKHPDLPYTVTGLVIIEATDEVGVLYRADYEGLRGIVFLRPLASFLEEVENGDERRKRFSLLKK